MSENIGDAFIRATHYGAMEPSDQQRGRPQPPLEIPPEPGTRTIPLPAPYRAQARIDLTDLIERRRSLRDFGGPALRLEELSYLLWCTQGVQQVIGREATIRTVPSAGARHALETYLCVNDVGGIEAGLYRFAALKRELLALRADERIGSAFAEACGGQRFLADAAVVFVWVADVYRMTWRYGPRGYRYVFLDAGHVCQNLYLAAEAIACGACGIAVFDDDAVNRLVGADGRERFAVYLASVGRRPKR